MTSRYFLLLALLPLLPAAAQAGTREDVMATAARCAGLPDDRSWLDCFYGSAQPMRAKLGLVPAPASQTAMVPPAPGMARAAAVTPAAVRPQPAPPSAKEGFLAGLLGSDAAGTKLAAYRFDKHGMFTVTLANGEVWQQMPDDVNFAHWWGAAPNYNVSVAEGKYGHASLMVQNDGQTYQVRRVN